MKYFIGLLPVILAFNAVFALPAGTPNDDAEVIDLPHRRVIAGHRGASDDDSDEDGFKDFKGVIDTGAGYPFLQPNPHQFSFNLGFFDSFEDIFRRLRTNLWNFPGTADDSGTGIVGAGAEGGFPFNIDPKEGNTTSTVKVVDGHKIEVNETVYGDNNNVFKVRVVNIRPVDSDETDGGDESTKTITNNDGAAGNPVTSAPANRNNNEADSDESREPLEKKSDDDNEIRGNIDDPEEEHTTPIIITADEDNSANLNAEFVTDNSLEEHHQQQLVVEGQQQQQQQVEGNGNIEAETNKPVNEAATTDVEDVAQAKEVESTTMASQHDDDSNVEATTIIGTADVEQPIEIETVSDNMAVENERLTIENNEETMQVNDNFNESSTIPAENQDDDDSSLTKDLSELELNAAVAAVGDGDDAAATTEQTDEDDYDNLRAELTDDEDDDDTNAAAVVEDEYNKDKEHAVLNNSNAPKQSKFIAAKQREHTSLSASSSDDEDGENGEPVEMGAAYNSEWENLAEDLASTNDKNNDLDNDIDIYDSVPVDLSNDIAVNEIAAAQPDFPINPDAEFIDVDTDGMAMMASSSIPKFQKLTNATPQIQNIK